MKAAQRSIGRRPRSTCRTSATRVILDAALTYAQLDQLTGKIHALDEAQNAAQKGAVHHRAALARRSRQPAGPHHGVNWWLPASGCASPKRKGRQTFCASIFPHLMGLPASDRSRLTPAVHARSCPSISQEDDSSRLRAVSNSPAVQLAEQKVAAQASSCQGRAQGTWPIIDLATQYAYLAKFNNYDLYYLSYTAEQLQWRH